MQETTTPETQETIGKSRVPLNYALYTIKGYLFQNNYKLRAQRLNVIKNLLQYNKYKKTKFRDLWRVGHEPSKYDNLYGDEYTYIFLKSYYIHNHYADAIISKIDTDFLNILDEIEEYLTYIHHNEQDPLTPAIITSYKQREWLKHTKQLGGFKDEDGNEEELQPEYIEPNQYIKDYWGPSFYIPEHSTDEDTLSWNKIHDNKLKEIFSKYDQLEQNERDLIDQIRYIEHTNQNNSKKLNQLKRSLEVSLKKSYASGANSPKLVNRSSNPKVNRFEFESADDVRADHITDVFDFTDFKHIFGLIETYFDLNEKHKYNAGNPLREVLQHFKDNTEKMQFSDKHRKILDTYMYQTSDRKKVAELLHMDTDKMRKMVERTISKNIAKYFSENVVN